MKDDNQAFKLANFIYSKYINEDTCECCIQASKTNSEIETLEKSDFVCLANDDFETQLLEGDPQNYPIYLAHKIMRYYHYHQYDKGGAEYYLHPEYVGNKGENIDEIIVGYLHDVIEDTPMTLLELNKYFPNYIVDAVDAITRRKGEKDESYFNRIKKNQIATKIKLQDLLHNLNFIRMNKLIPSEKDAINMIRYANQVFYLLNILKYKYNHKINEK